MTCNAWVARPILQPDFSALFSVQKSTPGTRVPPLAPVRTSGNVEKRQDMSSLKEILSQRKVLTSRNWRRSLRLGQSPEYRRETSRRRDDGSLLPMNAIFFFSLQLAHGLLLRRFRLIKIAHTIPFSVR